MADQTQDPGLLGTLGKTLSYALPAAAGAALGGPLGAMAGLAQGLGGNSEMQLRRQELAMRWQELNLESQKAQFALNDARQREKIISNLPEDEQALARADFAGWAQSKLAAKQWNMQMDTLQQDPDFANRLGVDEKNIKSLRALGPKEGSQVLDTLVKAKASGKYPGGVHGPVKKNGQWVYEGIGANGEVTDIPAGEPASTANIELKGAEGKPSKPPSPSMLSSLATKAYNDAMVTTPGYFGTHYGASTEDRKASAMAEFAEQLTSTGMDPDQAQELAEKYVAPKFESPKSRLAAKPKTAEKPAEKAPMGKAIGTTSKPDGDYNLKGRHIRVIGGKAYDIGKAE